MEIFLLLETQLQNVVAIINLLLIVSVSIEANSNGQSQSSIAHRSTSNTTYKTH